MVGSWKGVFLMNEPERKLLEQRARNLERLAEASNKREDWIAAADAWKKAGNREREQECRYNANERK